MLCLGVLLYYINSLHIYILSVSRIPYLQFSFLVQVEDSFFKVVHLAKDQCLIKHSVVTSQ